MLPAYGWSVDTARDGFEAILCFRAGRRAEAKAHARKEISNDPR